MFVKFTVALCALALSAQVTSSQFLPIGECGCNGFIPASTGGSFIVTSVSPVAPIGITVVSDNVYEGLLTVEGNLPLLGSVAVEGVMGTAGAGAVSYGCGDGVVDIVEEGPIVTGITADDNAGYEYGNGVFGYGLGLSNGLYGRGYSNRLYRYGLGRGNGIYGNIFGYGNTRYGRNRNGFYGIGSGYGFGAFY